MSNAPDPSTVAFVIAFCVKHLTQYGLSRIILFGSRAKGTATLKSDHDFMAIVRDDSPRELSTGGSMHDALYQALCKEQRFLKLGNIDLVISTQGYFASAAQSQGTFAHAANTYGKNIWP